MSDPFLRWLPWKQAGAFQPSSIGGSTRPYPPPGTPPGALDTIATYFFSFLAVSPLFLLQFGAQIHIPGQKLPHTVPFFPSLRDPLWGTICSCAAPWVRICTVLP